MTVVFSNLRLLYAYQNEYVCATVVLASRVGRVCGGKDVVSDLPTTTC